MRAAAPVALVAIALVACASWHARPAAYGGELEACVETAKTKEESKACREDVMRRYGRLDAGADQ